MNIKKSVTIELSTDEVASIISEFISRQHGDGFRIENVSFKIRHSCTGIGANERPVTAFSGAIITGMEVK